MEKRPSLRTASTYRPVFTLVLFLSFFSPPSLACIVTLLLYPSSVQRGSRDSSGCQPLSCQEKGHVEECDPGEQASSYQRKRREKKTAGDSTPEFGTLYDGQRIGECRWDL